MEQNHNMLRGISENGGIVFYGVDSTEIVREMERLHKTSAVTTAALGRLLTAASMMGIMLKSTQDSVTLQIKGGGPAGRLLAVSDGTGNVKGYVEHPVVELPPRADGHLNVGAAVGKDGTLDVIRDLGMREPYIGQVPLTSGEIAEDITTYFAISEQVPTVCALGVLVDKDLSVRCAGGFVVQLLPGATEEEIEHLEKNIKAMPSVPPSSSVTFSGKSQRSRASSIARTPMPSSVYRIFPTPSTRILSMSFPSSEPRRSSGLPPLPGAGASRPRPCPTARGSRILHWCARR